MVKRIVVVVVCNFFFLTQAHIGDMLNEARAELSFFPSLFFNWVSYDTLFNYNAIAGDACSHANVHQYGIQVQLNADGSIGCINDGKRVPLFLASIPITKKDFIRFRKEMHLAPKADLAIFSLNQKWERRWSGLEKALKKDGHATLYKYPTIDFTAPTLIDILRVVRDLLQRDDAQQEAVIVHCKSGRGRSATAVAAYLDTILLHVGIDATVDQIEAYMIAHRSQVKLNAKHRKAMQEFQAELRNAGSFDALLGHYEDAVAARDLEVAKL